MEGQSKLYMVAAIIGIIVILAMALTFAMLFSAYSRQRRKVLHGGLDDESVTDQLEGLKKKYLKFKRKKRKKDGMDDLPLFAVANSRTALLERRSLDSEEGIYVKSIERSKAHEKIMGAIGDAVYGLVIIVALVLAAFGIFMASNDKPVFIGNTSYIVIQTGSMEEKNEDNDYLVDNHLDNQIEQYSLIGIDKVDSIADIKMYDVIAFYDYDGNIIVHRVVAIRTDEDTGEITLETQGDANNGSMTDEMSIGQDRLVGIWDGYQNYALGIIITYLRSTLGIIALCGFGVFLFAYSIADSKVDKAFQDRMLVIAKEKDAVNAKKA